METELNLLGRIGQMSAAAEERRRHDVSCPGFHARAVTAAGVRRHLGQARSFRIMAGKFSTGGAGEKSRSETAALMRSGASREIGDQVDAEQQAAGGYGGPLMDRA
jgi:hypothetical protein